MRKALILVLAVAALCILVSCGNNGNSSANASSGGNASAPSSTSSSEAQSTQYSSDQLNAQDIDSQAPYRSKTWVLMGDSLTEKNIFAAKGYYDYVQEDLGCGIENFGKSEIGYIEPGPYGSFLDQARDIPLSGADCVTIFGSFNDLGKVFPLGTVDDEDPGTIGGCINLTIQTLRERFPDLPIGIATPTPWVNNAVFTAEGQVNDEASGLEKCDAYVSLLIAIAEKHDVPVLNLYETCGMNPDLPEDIDAYFTENGVKDVGIHLSSEGHKHMYPQWKSFVKQLFDAK